MSLDAIKTIGETEDTVRQMREDAKCRAAQALEEAREAGEAKVAEAMRQAKAESVQVMREAEQNAAKDAVALASNTENKKAAIRARTERTMPAAVAYIVERIVNDGCPLSR